MMMATGMITCELGPQAPLVLLPPRHARAMLDATDTAREAGTRAPIRGVSKKGEEEGGGRGRVQKRASSFEREGCASKRGRLVSPLIEFWLSPLPWILFYNTQ